MPAPISRCDENLEAETMQMSEMQRFDWWLLYSWWSVMAALAGFRAYVLWGLAPGFIVAFALDLLPIGIEDYKAYKRSDDR